MRTLIILTVINLISLNSYSQENDNRIFLGNIISDTLSFKEDYSDLTLTSILKSNNKIEIRLISNPFLNYPTYTILTFNKIWKVEHYYNYSNDYYNSSKDSLIQKRIKENKNLSKTFSKLVKNNIFSLPDQGSIEKGKYYYDLETNEIIGSGMSVCDGTCYWIEFKIDNQFRRYWFCNPESYSGFYDFIPEFKNYENIVRIFNELTKD